jgi:ElaB/YqjD/DUF883 family membrane-anchored ribosome-binding protein
MFSFLRPSHSGNGIRGGSIAMASDFADEARQRLEEAGDEAKKRLGDVEAMVKNLVQTHPGLTLGAALAAGVLIGWLIKRR